MSSSITLYYNMLSEPSKALVNFFQLAKVDVELYQVNFEIGEHKSPEYLKINPRGQVPAIKDGDFCLAESATIMRYICNTRDVPDSLYPKDAKLRA